MKRKWLMFLLVFAVVFVSVGCANDKDDFLQEEKESNSSGSSSSGSSSSGSNSSGGSSSSSGSSSGGSSSGGSHPGIVDKENMLN